MGFFGVKLKSGEKEAVEVPPGWCLQLCTAALAPAKKGSKSRDAEATLWVQVEGEIGDSRFLLGTLQAGGPYAQISVAHCLTSVDGEVIFEAEGTGVIHLTGFFNREYEPDLENDDMTENSSEESSEEKAGDSSEEESEESSEENADDGSVDSGEAEIEALRAILKDRAKRQGRGGGANGVGKGGGSNVGKGAAPAAGGKGRTMRSAAVTAAVACGTGGEEEHPEDDSDADSEYVPEDEEEGDGDGGSEAEEMEEEEEGEEEGGQKKGKRSRRSEAGGGAASKSSATGGGEGGGASSSSPPAKKSKSDGEEKEDADKPELTKQERKRQRKRENKKKAVEAKRGLEEAFGAMDADDGTPPVGVPLKNPKTKTLKGGLKIKDTIFGGGKIAVPGKNVKICYEGCFPDGRVFDKNQNRRRPLQFRIGMRSVIAGMDRGVEGMRVGGSREIAIPAALAYGARSTGPIPANQDLVFRVEMIDVLGK